jgi:hypothetical protein
VERSPVGRGAVAVRRADALVHVPEFGVSESFQDFLEAEACQSVLSRKCASFVQKNCE